MEYISGQFEDLSVDVHAQAIDPAALDFLPRENSVTEVPALKTEVCSDDSLVERLEAAPEDGKFRTNPLSLKTPWHTKLTDWLLSLRGLGCLASILFHLFILIFLAAWVIGIRSGTFGGPIQAGFSDSDELSLENDFGEELDVADIGISDAEELEEDKPEFVPKETVPELSYEGKPTEQPKVELSSLDQSLANMIEMNLSGRKSKKKASKENGSGDGNQFSGRSSGPGHRGIPGREEDVTDESEAAVEAGLAWLAAHQYSDGGWSFSLAERDEQGNPGECNGRCSGNGSDSSRMAATGIALLAFLGAGYDHITSSPYRETVENGLRYIIYHARQTATGVDFSGNATGFSIVYTHAIVAVTVCEAYALTGDSGLEGPAYGGISLIVSSQHNDGGWRYEMARTPDDSFSSESDTSVSGWQMLALKSAMSMGIEIPPEVFYKVNYFLDKVQTDIFYGYTSRDDGRAKGEGTTAVGTLMREYLGWDPKSEKMEKGITQLAEWFGVENGRWRDRKEQGFQKNGDKLDYNLYFAYYAALALHHHGGEIWHKTFAEARQVLIETQNKGETSSHEKGSWFFNDIWLSPGGRVLHTALSVLILETPYRYLPMYK